MFVKLEDIANVTTGVYEKGIGLLGDTLYLQAKHFDRNGEFRMDAIINQEIISDKKLRRHILQDKDLLITAKGLNNRVCLYRSDIGQAVASSTFFVMRLHSTNILPEYVKWYFNTMRMQMFLSSLTKGTHILSLSKKSLLNVELEIPSLEKQEEVLKLQLCWDLERRITLDLLEQKEIFYQTLLLNLTKSKLTKNE
ncbi:MAG: restriction endonuclease subunit S [Bacteroidota bacterium]